MNYRLTAERNFSELAQMRWDFQTEDDPLTPVVAKTDFHEKCLDFLRESLEKGDWAFWIAEDLKKTANSFSMKTAGISS